MRDYTPKTNKAELYITYRCNLRCVNCNQMCYLPTKVPDMTEADVRRFIADANEINWHPLVIIIGGEPTLHPEFLDFVRLLHAEGFECQVWSNGYSLKTRNLLDAVLSEKIGTVVRDTHKPSGSVVLYGVDHLVAPRDYGLLREPCWAHPSGKSCGICVDALGYSPCCVAGVHASWLGIESLRTRRLADLFDLEKMWHLTRETCSYCGFCTGIDAGKIAKCKIHHGTLLSPTWAKAIGV